MLKLNEDIFLHDSFFGGELMIQVPELVYVIIMIFTGALTGYITNDVALKMLFREYGIGKLKFGGVIIKTRKNLEKDLSQLIEKEIINHNTLKSQFHKPALREAISKTVITFFNDIIFKNTKNDQIGELPGFKQTVDNICAFLQKYLEEHLYKTFVKLSKNIVVSDIVSSEQALNLAQSIAKQILTVVKEKRIAETIVTDLYTNYRDMSLIDIVGDKITDTIINNLNELLNDIFDEMRYKNDREIHTLVSKLYRDLDFDTFVESMENYLGDKKLSYFISEDSLNRLYELFVDYLKNPNSNESIEVFCEGLLVALKKVDKPIIELFSGDLRLEIEKFLETQLPGIIDRLIEIIQKHKDEIEELIESSIDQTIYDQQTIRRLILQAIRFFLIENFTQKYDIINKIVEMLRGIDIEDLSMTISQQVIDLLHKQSISTIINELEANNILTAKLIASQVHRVLNFLCERYLSKDIEHSDFLEKRINDLIKLNLKPFVNNLTVTVITKQILYNEEILKFIKERISQSLRSIANMPISTFILATRVNDYAARFQEGIYNQLLKNETEIVDIIYKNLETYFLKHNVSEILKKEQAKAFKSEVIVDVIVRSLRNLIEDYRHYHIHDLFKQINSIDNLSENIVNAILNYLDNGLSNILEGNIARVIENNIKSFSNEEVLELMQEFMGKELKPLTILGAIMGGIVGIFLGYYQAFVLGHNTLFNWNQIKFILPNMAIYALVGYLTNVIAIYFIFRPYKPVFGLKWFQGVIPKQIPVLARAMGNVISNNLLSDTSINNMIQKNEKPLKEAFFKNIQKDDYKVLKTYLSEQSNKVTRLATLYIIRYLRDNNHMLASKLTDEVMGLNLQNVETQIFSELMADLFADKVNHSVDYITNFIANKLKSGKTIKELSDDLQINTVENKINNLIEVELGKFIERFNTTNYLVELISSNQAFIDKLISQKLNTVLSENAKVGLENFLYGLISRYLFDREKQRSLSNYIINEITAILNNNDSIDELFGGRFIELVNYNMETILERINVAVVKWLYDNRDEITESVTKRVIDQLSVVQQVGYKAINGDKLIRETVYRIIEHRLPNFISDKIAMLTTEFKNFFDELGKMRLKDARLELRKEELENFLNSVFESKEIEIKTRRFIHVVMNYFYEINTKILFDLFEIENSQDIISKFSDILDLVNEGCYRQLNLRKEHITNDVSLLVNKFITREIMHNRVRNLTLGITDVEIQELVQRILVKLNENDFLKHKMLQLVDAMFNHLKVLPLSALFDDLYLKQDIRNLIRKLTIDINVEDALMEVINDLYCTTIRNYEKLIENDFNERFLTDIINATYDAIKENIFDILRAVDFKEVTVREVSAMDAKQIKTLFDSFGRSYFRKLELYGIFGGIFAIEEISLIFLISYIVQMFKKPNKEEVKNENKD